MPLKEPKKEKKKKKKNEKPERVSPPIPNRRVPVKLAKQNIKSKKDTHKRPFLVVFSQRGSCHLGGGGDGLDLDLGHGSAGATKVGDLCLWVLGVVI